MDKLLTRAIECGALVDPWNILGFQGQFSLFPAPENSVLDHRVDQLVELMEEIFAVAAQLWRAAALRQAPALQATMARWMGSLAEWWDQFAATTVASIEAFSGAEAYESARHVAQALEAWHKAGAASGDIAFWRQHVEAFTSPKAYALVVEALLDAGDLVAAMALLVQWLSQAGQLPLEQGEFSFHVLARRWLAKACAAADVDATAVSLVQSAEAQTLVRKFFEVLEANADDFWLVPDLERRGPRSAKRKRAAGEDEELPEEDRELFAAAYDEMVYVDSTADGVEADMLEAESAGQKTDYELELEGRRVRERLAFLGTVSQLWKTAALACGSPAAEKPLDDDVLGAWLAQANRNHERLLELLASMDVKTVEPTSASRDALLEYERQRSVKEMLLDAAIGTAVDTVDAQQVLRGLLHPASQASQTGPIDVLCRAVLAGEPDEARRRWHAFLATLEKQPLLYVSLGRGGDPREIVAARGLQPMLRDLARALPKLGLLRETCQLLETARHMEATHAFAAGAVSEFDRLFEVGYKALVESLVEVSRSWPVSPEDRDRGRELADADLVDVLEQLTESLLKQWLAHSRTLRLSVLEKIGDEKAWQALVKFIERYGHDLLLQRFLNLGNLRAILHQGVENWLVRLSEDPDAGDDLLVVRDLDRRLPRLRSGQTSDDHLRSDRRELRRVPRLQQHHHPERSRRTDLHAVGLPPPARPIRSHRLAFAPGGPGPRNSGPRRSQRSRRNVVPGHGRTHRRRCRRAHQAIARLASEIWHAATDRRRSSGRTIHPPPGHRPRAGAGDAGRRGRAPRATERSFRTLAARNRRADARTDRRRAGRSRLVARPGKRSPQGPAQPHRPRGIARQPMARRPAPAGDARNRRATGRLGTRAAVRTVAVFAPGQAGAEHQGRIPRKQGRSLPAPSIASATR